MNKIDPIYIKMVNTLKSYCDDQKHISIERAREVLGRIHRFHHPYNTIVISRLMKLNLIHANGTRGMLEILI